MLIGLDSILIASLNFNAYPSIADTLFGGLNIFDVIFLQITRPKESFTLIISIFNEILLEMILLCASFTVIIFS